ncbi:MAG TPA: class I SAM-dependent RNA methyltransferase [Dehalococcoidia bacterium]|nr:class I SAM-dependent RNA methyltransferase [Dehalococcoidia bacterium]MDP6274217.1 class I SAM-dependent RNA methyltransferase [Dehalococcoidia bacterium]MDP7160481.1 class I SAM-dependent RNA methyltransferase [Dehalococcoidia bacterium]MDP7212090.1 class I SAM-dependent RNA methyltransferase [Dehalococcoidia bacterium]MDP7515086.1 class I SAM-dependent RNA methyltransferase [Dehalococcoidia bacterium]
MASANTRNGSRGRRRYKGPWPTDELGIDRGDTFDVELGSMNERGELWSEHGGFRVLVEGGIPGESVTVEVLRRFPEYIGARVVEVADASADRVEPACRYAAVCTGCQWQHVSYERQLQFKRDMVIDVLATEDSVKDARVLPTLPSPQQLGYRNHARFSVGRKLGEVGYVNAITRSLAPVDRCLLMHDSINEVLKATQKRVKGMTQFSVRVGVGTGDRLVQPRLKGDGGEGLDIESGGQYLREKILGWEFRVAGSSFFQVNTTQAERMVEMIRDRLELSGSQILIDAYAGVGVFAVLLAPYAGRVIAIEDSPSAVEDGKRNAEGLDNVEMVLGRSEQVLSEFDSHVDTVILDPSRKGCHPDVIAAMSRLAPDRIVLVSCDVGSMVRDLAALVDGPFVLEEIQPVDMFPQTRHIENVSFLRLEV